MNIVIDEHSVWTTALKADRLLNRLPVERIAHLGDGFDWRVNDTDVVVARRYLVGARVHAIVLGRDLASIVVPDAIVSPHPTARLHRVG